MSKENLLPVLIWIVIHIICVGTAFYADRKKIVQLQEGRDGSKR
jgi:hypothetical protein